MNSAKASQIIGTIGAIQTLIENFPMSVLENYGGKKYTNIIDFILDLLKQIGIDDRVIVNKIIEWVFNVPNAAELYNKVDSINQYVYREIKDPDETQIELCEETRVSELPEATYDSPDYVSVNGLKFYYKDTSFFEKTSDFLNKLEDSCKSLFINILTAIVSCSAIPFINDVYMDSLSTAYTHNFPDVPDKDFSGEMIIPLSMLDPYGLLNYCPTNEVGKHFYDVDETLTVNSLYKTFDLNAFIWYVMNRGDSDTQIEKNKMLWDSRVYAVNNGFGDWRATPQDWNGWLNSKVSGDTFIYPPNISTEQSITEFYNRDLMLQYALHPIVQLERYNDTLDSNARKIKVSISAQSFFRNHGSNGWNKTIYDFNKDYLENIRIFSPKIILTNMIETLLHGDTSWLLDIDDGFNGTVIENRVNQIIKGVLEEDDSIISDCFFTFSNEEYNEMLKETDMRRYSAKYLGSETANSVKIDDMKYLKQIDTINSMATINEKIEAITKTVYDIAVIPSEDESVKDSDGANNVLNSKWLNDIVMAIVKPLIRAILTPQIMLLFLINLNIMGLINFESLDAENLTKVMNMFYKKILGILKGLIKQIVDFLVLELFKWFLKEIGPILMKWSVELSLEAINDWIRLLIEALACIPIFDFSAEKVLTELDDVNYADIIPQQNKPESSNTC